MKYAIATFDIGKTNKKLIVFDEQLNPLFEDKAQIGEVVRNGILCDDAERIVAWLKSSFRNAVRKYNMKALSVTTHGRRSPVYVRVG
jgi:L-fuculokinase